MHLAPTSILHVFVNGNLRAEVQFVEGEPTQKFRVVMQRRTHDEWRTLSPEYRESENRAIERAKRFINEARQGF